METKYKIGDIVHQAYTESAIKRHDCPDCLGTKVWIATSPAGDTLEFSCPRCSSTFQTNSDMSLEYQWYMPRTRILTIGSVRTNTSDEKPISYMCEETGVGSGTIHYEESLFTNKDDAVVAATEICLERNQKDQGIVERYSSTLDLSDYQFSVIKSKETEAA